MIAYSRRQFLAFTGATASSIAIGGTAGAQSSDTQGVVWNDVQSWGVEGKGWLGSEMKKYFDRLPARADGVVRGPVWNLSRHSAGMLTRFESDASEIWVDYTVTSPSLALPHMPATGVSGVDLYAQQTDGSWSWLAVSRPTSTRTEAKLISGLAPGSRAYMLYLPLYNGTESLKIGVPEESRFVPIEPRTAKPMVFYGTSITHGACASRPGMPHPAILGRWLDRPVINLGFSGNGKMEPEVGRFLAELDPAIYVIDCLPNMVANEIAERAVPLVTQLKTVHPDTPVLLVEDRTYANAPFVPSKQDRHRESRAALRAAYEQLLESGQTGIGYVEGPDLLGSDRDDTTDGSHPSDLGFYRQAKTLAPAITSLLGR